MANIDDVTVEMMLTLLKEGMAPTFVARGLRAHGLCSALLRFFSGPILTYEPAMARLFPPWLPATVYVERLDLVVAEDRLGQAGDLATLADALAYLYSAAITAAPATNGRVAGQALAETWAPIYGYLAFETMSKHSLMESGQVSEVLRNYESHSLTALEQERLLTLRREIRHSVVKFARRRELVWPKSGKGFRLPPGIPSFHHIAGRQPGPYHFGKGAEQCMS